MELVPYSVLMMLPLSLTLHWYEAPQQQQALGYRVQLEREADHVVLVDTAGVTALSHQLSGLEAGTLYTWRVCTLNGDWACGDWAQRRFTTISGQPLLSLSPSPPQPLAFHAVAAGATAADTLTITNTGAAPLSVGLTLVDDGSGGSGPVIFAFAPEAVTDTLLAAGAFYQVAVRFTPSEALSYSGALSLTHNAPGLSPVTITLQGSGLDGPALWLAPGALAFGPVVVGDVKADTVWITNSGTGTLTGSYALPAGSAFQFEDGTWGPVEFSLDASVSDTLSVVVFFEAGDLVSYTGVLTFYDASGMQVLAEVSLSGLGTLPASATGRFYYVRDHLGSVRATVNESGAVVHYDDYYPFGAPLPSRTYVAGDEGSPAGKPRYTGHEREWEMDDDVYYAGARYYDALIARWNATDPLDEFHSPYVYVGNNPINRIDPTGMFSDGPSHFATQYFIDGQLVYDDGVDNGLVVHTTWDIIFDNADSEGAIDWDRVRNHSGSNVVVADRQKYNRWRNTTSQEILDAYDGRVGVSIDDKGNVSIREPMSPWLMGSFVLGPFAIDRLLRAGGGLVQVLRAYRSAGSIAEGPVVRLFHKGALDATSARALHVTPDKAVAANLARSGQLYEFQVPQRVLLEWQKKGWAHAGRFTEAGMSGSAIEYKLTVPMNVLKQYLVP